MHMLNELKIPQKKVLFSKLLNHFSIPQEGIFTNKMLMSLFIPVLIEQIMTVAIGIADTVMVSHVGETAVAGISFITTFNTSIKVLMSGLSAGGSIILSQYIGKGDYRSGKKALKMSFYSIISLALLASIILYIYKELILSMIVGAVELEVMENARIYFTMSTYSFPFFAIYYIASASYRAMGSTRITMIFSSIMMLLNLTIKAILIYVINLGVLGVGISTLVSTAFVSIIMLIMICNKKNMIYIEKIFAPNLDFKMIKRIYALGIPTSIENGIFQIGILLTQRIVAVFGTIAIAADAIAKSLIPASNIICACFSIVIVTVVGQCMGAGKIDQAVIYTKHLLKISYIISLFINIICILLNKFFVGIFDLSYEVSVLASNIFYIFCIGTIFLYPVSFVLPNALRATGDTKFTMVVSILSMFIARIGLALMSGKHLSMGLYGVWIAMQIDWIVRSTIFSFRYKQGKWKNFKVV